VEASFVLNKVPDKVNYIDNVEKNRVRKLLNNVEKNRVRKLLKIQIIDNLLPTTSITQ